MWGEDTEIQAVVTSRDARLVPSREREPQKAAAEGMKASVKFLPPPARPLRK